MQTSGIFGAREGRQATPRELAAAHALGEAILALLTMAREREANGEVPAPRGTWDLSEATEDLIRGPQPLLVSGQTAARMLGISRRTLWSLTAPRGPIECVKLGHLVRYSVEDLKLAITRMKRSGHPTEFPGKESI